MFSVRQEVEIPAAGVRGVCVREIEPAVWRVRYMPDSEAPATRDFDEAELRRVRRARRVSWHARRGEEEGR